MTLSVPKLLHLLKPHSLVFLGDYNILWGCSYFLAPVSTDLVLSEPGNSSSSSFSRNVRLLLASAPLDLSIDPSLLPLSCQHSQFN